MICLPQYHTQYSQTEVKSAQVMESIANRNNKFKIADVETIFYEVIDKILIRLEEMCS